VRQTRAAHVVKTIDRTPRRSAGQGLPRPFLVFAHDEVLGAGKTPAAAARLLVVEDDFLVASQIEAALKDAGYEVAEVVSSCDAALGAAASGGFTLAIMDIRLADDVDGVECALELFRKHQVRCVFATAHDDEDVRRRAAPARPLAWLQKPYTMASLVTTVRAALGVLGDKN